MAMAADPSGNTYVASGSTVTALDPSGSVIYEAQFKGPVSNIAPGNGMLWVLSGALLFQVDGQGNESLINYTICCTVFAVTADPAGNLYLAAATQSSYYSVIKLSTSGVVTGTFSLDPYGPVTAIAADASGAVYAVGNPLTGFTATPGAYQTTVPKMAESPNEGYLLKIAPTLDHLVYATLLYQGQTSGLSFPTPSAVAADSLGNAYVGGYFYPAPDQPFPANQIGAPLPADDVSPYVLKLDPQGSSLIWCDGLGSGWVDSLTVLPDGRVRALLGRHTSPITVVASTYAGYDEALFTISSAGDTIQSANFLGGVMRPPGGLLAAATSTNTPPQMLVALDSLQIPVALNDQVTAPVLLNFTEPAPTADLSLSLSLVQPLVSRTGTIAVLATVTNNGPAAAEAVQVEVNPVGDGSVSPLQCLPDAVAICNAGVSALIPRLPAGTTMHIEFSYDYDCGGLTCNQSVNGGIFALTSDPDLANNFVTLQLPITTGFEASLVPPAPLVFYRSDSPLSNGLYGYSPPTADPSLTVWAPSPQTYGGNIWYFDSWADGNRDDPRTFDASQGIPESKGAMNFHTALPIGVDPGSLDLVALPGSSPLQQAVRLVPVSRPGNWTIGQPAASWLTLSSYTDTGGSEIVTGTANTAGLAPGFYTTTFPAKLVVSDLPDASVTVHASLRIMDAAPTMQPNGIVNAADSKAGPLSPFEIITISGTGLGPRQLVRAFVPVAGSLPTTLAGTSVEIQGTLAKLLYVQDKSIVAIVPYPLYYATPMIVTIKLGGTAGVSLTVPPAQGPNPYFAEFSPTLFTAGSTVFDGPSRHVRGPANSDGSLNSPRNPAKRGSAVSLRMTGLFTEAGLTCDFSLTGRFPLRRSSRVNRRTFFTLARFQRSPVGSSRSLFSSRTTARPDQPSLCS